MLKQILKNLFSLSLAEVIGKAVGLITAAYLARVINPEGFGILNFASAFVSYFVLTVIFGLDIYGNREAAKNKGDSSKIVNSILSLKIFFAIILYLTFAVIVFFIKQPMFVRGVLLISGLNLFVTAANLDWYFNGIEKMSVVAVGKILLSLLNLCGILIFVHSADDILLAAGVSTFSGAANSALLLGVYSRYSERIRLAFQWEKCKPILRESFPIFFSSLMIMIYYNLDMVMLGYMKTQSEVGIYSAAYKIFLTGIIPFSLILLSFFPSLSKTGLIAGKDFKNLIKNYSIFLVSCGVLMTLILYFFSQELVSVIFGSRYLQAAPVLRILSMNALVISINILFGNPLIAWGKQKAYSAAITLGAVTNIILNFILIPGYSYTGAAFATLLSEVVVFGGVFILFQSSVYKKL